MDTILPLLRKNARASIPDLAKAAGLSEEEVAHRIEKLETTGVVLAYHAIVDPEKTADENVTRPDWNGDRPKPTCINSGSRNGSAPMPSRNRKPPMMAARIVGSRSIEKSSTGDPVRRACMT